MWREWTQADFLAELREAIDRKDKPTSVGAVNTTSTCWWSEQRRCTLQREDLQRLLDGAAPFACSLITDACIALGYQAGLEAGDPQAYPAVPIEIRRNDPEFQNQKSERPIR